MVNVKMWRKNVIDQEVKTAKCLKCKRTCKTRSVECINGHWVHYSCDKLSESEISTIEDEGNNIVYTCKSCSMIVRPKTRALNWPTIKANNCHFKNKHLQTHY